MSLEKYPERNIANKYKLKRYSNSNAFAYITLNKSSNKKNKYGERHKALFTYC